MAHNKQITLKYVEINGEYHIADNDVVREIDRLEQALFDEQTAHAKTKALMNKDIRTLAERIALNLNSGMQDSDICLAHSLNHFDKTRDGEPVFEFRNEVMRRIILALNGKNASGNDYL